MEHTFTDANFETEVLQSSTPVFVDFWAPWCGPCQQMGPIVAALAQEYEGQNIKLGKCNVDDNPSTPGNYAVLSIPTFIVFKAGTPAGQLVGGVSKEKLKEFIDKHVNTSTRIT